MLYSNSLYKSIETVCDDNRRVISVNELVEKRLHQLEAERKADMMNNGEIPDSDGGLEEEVTAYDLLKVEEECKEMIAEAQSEAEAIKARANSEALEYVNSQKELIASEREDAIRQGHDEGYEAGMLEANKLAEKMFKDIDEKRIFLEQKYHLLFNEMEPKMAEVITDLYEHVFNVELEEYRDILTFLISKTLKNSEGSRELLVHVSKEDYSNVLDAKDKLYENVGSGIASFDIISDAKLSAGECRIETDLGMIECGLGVQLKELGKKIRMLSYSRESKCD